MRLKAISNIARHLVRRGRFFVRRNSPAILMVTAGVSGVGCVVSACVATKKLDPVIEHHNETLSETKAIIENEPEHFNEKQARRMITRVYIHTAFELAKLYAPAFALGMATVGCVAGGYKIQANRIAYLSSALMAAEQKIRVLKEDERDRDLASIEDPEERKKKAEEHPVDGNEAFELWWSTGDEKFLDPRIYGAFANPRQIRQMEEFFNKILPIWGIVYMNDIHVALGKSRDKKASQAGWVWDPNGGDHQIDLGLRNQRNADFMSGNDTSGCWIIPNCQAYILDKATASLGDSWAYYNDPKNRRVA